MIRVAIVEDEPHESSMLKDFLSRFTAENKIEFDVDVFPDALEFLNGFQPFYQIVFMDIEMPHLNGMEAAKRLRELDSEVPLVFITNMAQFAIKGYEVSAVDFILKPVNFYRLSSLLQKVLRRIEANQGTTLTIRSPDKIHRIPASRLEYLTVEDHLLLYHTEDGILESWGTLKKALEELPPNLFFQVNKSTVVNLCHVKSIAGDKAVVGTAELPISRGRKQEVIAALSRILK